MTQYRRRMIAAVLSLLAAAPAANAATPTTTRVSVNSSGAESDVLKGSHSASISANGRFVAFISTSTNFAAGDTNNQADVFVRDRKLGTTQRVSIGNNGAQANGGLLETARISADGRFVAFVSNASTLDPGASAGLPRLYRYNREAGSLQLIPLPSGASSIAGTNPGGSYWPSISISADGSRVAFRSTSGGVAHVWWWDAATGQVRRASESATGTGGNGGSFDAVLSGDGRFLAFTSDAKNLGGPFNPSYRDVFVKNLQTGAVDRVSDVYGSGESNLHASNPALSFDGCIAAFYSDATNLVAGDTTAPHPKFFSRDRCSDTGTSIVSVVGANSETKIQSLPPVTISHDGCKIAFLQSGGGSAQVRDRCVGQTTRADLSTAGNPSSGGIRDVSISASGRYVAFVTTSDSLVPGDNDGAWDVFVRDLATNTAPVAAFTAQVAGNRVTADASASDDPDGYQLTGTINWGDGTPPQPGLIGLHDYASAGTYGVTVTVTDSDGISTQAFKAVTVGAPATTGGDSAAQSGDGGLVPDLGTTQLILDRLSLGKTRFVAGKSVTSKTGTALTLRLNAAATVTLTVERAVRGRRSGGKCKTTAKKGARCTTYKRVGTVIRSLTAGTSSIAISGTLSGRKLATGAYRATVVARGADGQATTPKTLTFTIVKPKKTKGK